LPGSAFFLIVFPFFDWNGYVAVLFGFSDFAARRATAPIPRDYRASVSFAGQLQSLT
jgi:hypothetical protein